MVLAFDLAINENQHSDKYTLLQNSRQQLMVSTMTGDIMYMTVCHGKLARVCRRWAKHQMVR